MIELTRYREALDLAQTGVYAIRRSPTPKTMAMLHVIEARAHAGLGDVQPCYRAPGAAQEAFARAGSDTDPSWCAFFDKGELYGLLGVTLRDLALADTEHAAQHAADARLLIEQAIQQRPRQFLRSRVMDMDGLAVVNVLLGEAEAAGKAAGAALSMAGAVTSIRVISRLQRTTQLAQERFPRIPAITELGRPDTDPARGRQPPTELNIMQWKVISERALYTDQWLDVRTADVELPDGRHLDHRFIRMVPSAGVVLVDDQRRALLLWRHRFITGRWGWEIPMGRIDQGETPAQAAAREVEEETGWRPGRLQPLVLALPAAGITDLAHHIFVGEDPVETGAPADGFESAVIQWVPLDDVPGLIAKQDIVSASTMAALLLLLANGADPDAHR